MILGEPAASPVTKPDPLTVAKLELLVPQVPEALFPEIESCEVCPIAMLLVPLTDPEVGGSVIVITLVAVALAQGDAETVYVMVEEPAL